MNLLQALKNTPGFILLAKGGSASNVLCLKALFTTNTPPKILQVRYWYKYQRCVCVCWVGGGGGQLCHDKENTPKLHPLLFLKIVSRPECTIQPPCKNILA